MSKRDWPAYIIGLAERLDQTITSAGSALLMAHCNCDRCHGKQLEYAAKASSHAARAVRLRNLLGTAAEHVTMREGVQA